MYKCIKTCIKIVYFFHKVLMELLKRENIKGQQIETLHWRVTCELWYCPTNLYFSIFYENQLALSFFVENCERVCRIFGIFWKIWVATKYCFSRNFFFLAWLPFFLKCSLPSLTSQKSWNTIWWFSWNTNSNIFTRLQDLKFNVVILIIVVIIASQWSGWTWNPYHREARKETLGRLFVVCSNCFVWNFVKLIFIEQDITKGH